MSGELAGKELGGLAPTCWPMARLGLPGAAQALVVHGHCAGLVLGSAVMGFGRSYGDEGQSCAVRAA